MALGEEFSGHSGRRCHRRPIKLRPRTKDHCFLDHCTEPLPQELQDEQHESTCEGAVSYGIAEPLKDSFDLAASVDPMRLSAMSSREMQHKVVQSEPKKFVPNVQPLEVPKLDYRRFQQNFQKDRLLGCGAFGEVWKCRSLKDGKDYGVKVVRFRAGGPFGLSIERRVVREAQTLSSMCHPNVLHYYNAWIETDEGYGGHGTRSETTCSTLTSSSPSTPFAPPSPAFRPKVPLLLPEGSCTDGSHFSYDGGSLGSCGVFFEWNEQEILKDSCDSFSMDRKECLDHLAPPKIANVDRSGLEKGPSLDRLISPLTLEDSESSQDYTATLYLQVELCRDDSLQTWIAERNLLFANSCLDDTQSWFRTALRILVQCLRALAHIHSLSCIHRDVKPSNILFAFEDGAVRLADFGLAKVIDEDESGLLPRSLTRARSDPTPLPVHDEHTDKVLEVTEVKAKVTRRGPRGTIGTPSYASPEQLAGQSHLGTSTDVYSLGLVLAELICPVQTQMERAAVLESVRIRRELPKDAAAAFPALASLVLWMTAPEASKRPSARDVLRTARQVEHLIPMVKLNSTGKSNNSTCGTSSKSASVIAFMMFPKVVPRAALIRHRSRPTTVRGLSARKLAQHRKTFRQRAIHRSFG